MCMCRAYLVALVGVCSWLGQLLLQLVEVGAPGSHVQWVGHLLQGMKSECEKWGVGATGRGMTSCGMRGGNPVIACSRQPLHVGAPGSHEQWVGHLLQGYQTGKAGTVWLLLFQCVNALMAA